MGHRAAFRGGRDAESGRCVANSLNCAMQRGFQLAQLRQLLRPRAIAENL